MLAAQNSWFQFAEFGLDAQHVIALRMMKLARGGLPAAFEANLMVTEKMLEAGKAVMTLATGGSMATVLGSYHEEVRRNQSRLSRRRKA